MCSVNEMPVCRYLASPAAGPACPPGFEREPDRVGMALRLESDDIDTRFTLSLHVFAGIRSRRSLDSFPGLIPAPFPLSLTPFVATDPKKHLLSPSIATLPKSSKITAVFAAHPRPQGSVPFRFILCPEPPTLPRTLATQFHRTAPDPCGVASHPSHESPVTAIPCAASAIINPKRGIFCYD